MWTLRGRTLAMEPVSLHNVLFAWLRTTKKWTFRFAFRHFAPRHSTISHCLINYRAISMKCFINHVEMRNNRQTQFPFDSPSNPTVRSLYWIILTWTLSISDEDDTRRTCELPKLFLSLEVICHHLETIERGKNSARKIPCESKATSSIVRFFAQLNQKFFKPWLDLIRFIIRRVLTKDNRRELFNNCSA